MIRSAPLITEPMVLSDHPATRAWSRIDSRVPVAIRLCRTESRSKPAIYRLTFAEPRAGAVYAKRSLTADLALERRVYEEILPGLPLTVPRCRGSFTDGDGSTWLFVESVGDRRLSKRNPRHHALAAHWLGQLHGRAATAVPAAKLPDAGPGRYLAHLRSGRDAIRRHFENPGFSSADRVVLARLVDELDALEARWPALERACAGLPVTLVHGDFRMKNVRVRVEDASPVLYALDWEMAGWGIPAADLAGAFGPGPTVRIDPSAYREVMGDLSLPLEPGTLRTLSILGRIFQALAGANWASASLIFENRRYLLKSMGSMRIYRGEIVTAIREGAEWLGWS